MFIKGNIIGLLFWGLRSAVPVSLAAGTKPLVSQYASASLRFRRCREKGMRVTFLGGLCVQTNLDTRRFEQENDVSPNERIGHT